MSRHYVENEGRYEVTNLREAYAVTKIPQTLPVVITTFGQGNKELEAKLFRYYIDGVDVPSLLGDL